MTSPRPRRPFPMVALAALLGLLGACGVAPTPVPPIPSPPAVKPAAPPATVTCTNATQSYAPTGPLPSPGALPAGSTMAKIRKRGRIIVGISADSYLLGSRNPISGQIEGFDIDLLKAIAEAILGPKPQIQLRVITAAQRIPVLEGHEVDMVVRNFTMSCDRWEKIGFSAVYYESGQKILVRKGSEITGLDTLAGHKVCAPVGTSSMDNLVRLAPKAIPVPSTNHTGCLVELQRGNAEAITGDDTVLAGLAAQDPFAIVLAGKPFTAEPYGVGVPKEDVDLARFINGVLEQLRADGRWQKSYNRWFASTLGPATQPQPSYGRSP